MTLLNENLGEKTLKDEMAFKGAGVMMQKIDTVMLFIPAIVSNFQV